MITEKVLGKRSTITDARNEQAGQPYEYVYTGSYINPSITLKTTLGDVTIDKVSSPEIKTDTTEVLTLNE